MVRIMDYKIDEFERVVFQDADEKIIKQIALMLNAAMDAGDRVVNWEDFKDYCYEIILVPMSAIERCIPEAIARSRYKKGVMEI